MGRKTLVLKNYSSSDIKALFNLEDKYRIGMRLYAVYQLSKGVASRKLEELYNTSFKQICNWAHQFDEEGIDGLRDKPKSGRIPKLTMEQRTELKDILDTYSPESFGYNTATWSGPVVIDFVKSKWAVEYKSAQIYNILHSLGFSFQRAKGKFPEADKEKQTQFGEYIKKTSDNNLSLIVSNEVENAERFWVQLIIVQVR